MRKFLLFIEELNHTFDLHRATRPTLYQDNQITIYRDYSCEEIEGEEVPSERPLHIRELLRARMRLGFGPFRSAPQPPPRPLRPRPSPYDRPVPRPQVTSTHDK